MDHLFRLLGLQYGLFRSDAVVANDPAWIFGGSWRLWKTNPEEDPLTITVSKWIELKDKIVPHLESIEIYFAPTPGLSNNERCHLEGCIAAQLRRKHPRDGRFYPADCHTGVRKPLGIKVEVTSAQPIEGLVTFLEI